MLGIIEKVNQQKYIIDSNGFYIKIKEENLENFKQLSTNENSINIFLYENIDSIEKKLLRPKSNEKLPIKMRIEEVKSWINLEKEMRIISNFTIEKYKEDYRNKLYMIINEFENKKV